MTLKQIIVMRTDLGMRKGKMIAQGAHASTKAILPYLSAYLGTASEYDQFVAHKELVDEWLAGQFTKVCLRIDSEDELLALYEKARDAGLIVALITDSGKTEFHGQPTNTCIAIGPDHSEKIDAVTGHLKLL